MTPQEKALKRGINLVLPVIRAVERKEWRPTPAAELLLAALRDELRGKDR